MTHNYACKRLSQVTTNSNWKLKLAIDDFFFQFRPVSAAPPPSPLPPPCRQLAQLRVMIAILTLDFDAFESWHARSTFYGHFLQNSWLVQSKPQPANFNLQNQMEEKMPSSLDYTLHYKYIPPPLGRRAPNAATRAKKILQGDYLDGFALEKISLRGVLNKQPRHGWWNLTPPNRRT